MKSNELMIGDWVLCFGQRVRVNCVASRFVGLEGLDSDTICKEGMVEPIPITPEILEKNGFKRTARGLEWKERLYGYRGQDVSSNSPIEIIYRDGLCSVSNPHIGRVFQGMIDYVHELQNALRLCGIEKTIEL